jgi:hypothetical protein
MAQFSVFEVIRRKNLKWRFRVTLNQIELMHEETIAEAWSALSLLHI